LKHFSITQNRGKVRGLPFYTSNSIKGKKVGIVGDCEKLDTLRNNGYINESINLICCAFVTHRPTKLQIDRMTNSFHTYPELIDWSIVYPVPLDEQQENIGIITLQKNGILM
jgi:hypothetical protein